MIKQVIIGATLLLALASVPAVSLYAKTNHETGPDKDKDTHKVFVCKYVGTPGVDERLQTGQNPISVSVANKGYEVGSYFVDAQGRSYVLAEDNTKGGGQAGEPSVSDCPAPDDGDDDTVVMKTVYVCHYTPGQGGKYEHIEVSVNAADQNPNLKGHEGHDMDLIGDQYKDGCPVDNTDTPTDTDTPDEPGKGDFTPTPVVTNETPTPSTTQPVVATDVEALPYTAGEHSLAYTLIAAGLATVVIGLGVSLKSLYRHSA